MRPCNGAKLKQIQLMKTPVGALVPSLHDRVEQGALFF
jgi:hypothetical protein